METLVNLNLFKGIYRGKKVFVTGHTGFKGSWLYYWLQSMGAIVKGYALEPNTSPSHWELLQDELDDASLSVYGDIRDLPKLKEEIEAFEPDIIFHLAAQPLVRLSYDAPIETYDTNVIGTLNVFEACRPVESIKAIINITTDKCYENKEWLWGYRENDRLGGYDPYSASKACVEIMTSSYRNSFLNNEEYGKKHHKLIASVRAGNVIGGGDWAMDRLVPDIMRATKDAIKTRIRNRLATRPWQHVLEPLSGYLLLGQKLLEGHKAFAESWNFGPEDSSNLNVGEVCEFIAKYWEKAEFEFDKLPEGPHEAKLLKLDCSKANNLLNWYPVWKVDATFRMTSKWYKAYYENNELYTQQDLLAYIKMAAKQEESWTK